MLDETLVTPNIALVQIVYVRYGYPGITLPPVNGYPQIIIYFYFLITDMNLNYKSTVNITANRSVQ